MESYYAAHANANGNHFFVALVLDELSIEGHEKLVHQTPLEVDMHAAQPNKVRLGGVYFMLHYIHICARLLKGSSLRLLCILHIQAQRESTF